jgi:hypothetical protein
MYVTRITEQQTYLLIATNSVWSLLDHVWRIITYISADRCDLKHSKTKKAEYLMKRYSAHVIPVIIV